MPNSSLPRLPLRSDASPFDLPEPPSTEWLEPQLEESVLERYLQVLRERWKLVVACVVLSLLAAFAYLAQAEKVYEAEADLLISPVQTDDPALVGLGLLTQGGDPSRNLETVSRLVGTTEVARVAQRRLRLGGEPRALLDDVQARPVAESNIVAITARAQDARVAQRLATGFADAVVEDSTAKLHQRLDASIRRVEDRLAAQPPNTGQGSDDAAQVLRQQLNQLENLRAADDPTLRVASAAELPGSPVAPRPLLSVIAGLLAGLVLGVTAAFTIQALDNRLRREEQLRRMTRLPLLTRIPNERTSRDGRPLDPTRLSPASLEAYRTLRATLGATRNGLGGSRSILVTSPSSGEGKSTTAINLAASLALAGQSVILIEADLRRPSIGRALDLEPRHDVMDVLLERVDLEDALVTTESLGSQLGILLARPNEASGSVGDGLFLPTAQRLIEDAKQLADFVIIDSPPLTEVIDGLGLAERADEVLLVVRLGRTQLGRIARLGELLARRGIRPDGFALVGVPRSSIASEYYVSSKPSGRAGSPLSRR